MADAAPWVELSEVSKRFPARASGGGDVPVLEGVSLALRSGEQVALVGPSGSGKSTLLHLTGALLRPTSGEVRVGGRSLAGRSEEELARFRNEDVGFVFQFHQLLMDLSALENVAVPALLKGERLGEAMGRAGRLLEEMGLGARVEARPWELSGGEQQRVAVARALMNGPRLLLADEPTGDLDQSTGERVWAMLQAACRARSAAMLVVTHNEGLGGRCDRMLRLHGGRLAAEPQGGTT